MTKFPLTRRAPVSYFLKIASPQKSAVLLAALLMIAATRLEAAPTASTRNADATQNTTETALVSPAAKAVNTAPKNNAAKVTSQKSAAGKISPQNAKLEKPAAKTVAKTSAAAPSENPATKTVAQNPIAPNAPQQAVAKPAPAVAANEGAKKVAPKKAVALKNVTPHSAAKNTSESAAAAAASASASVKSAPQNVVAKKVVPKSAVVAKSAASNATIKTAPAAKVASASKAVAVKSAAPNSVAKNAAVPAVKVAPVAKIQAPRVLARPAGAGERAQTVAFANGAQLVTRPDRAAPVVVMSLVMRVGAGDENAANAGWRRLLSEAMLRASSAKNLDEKLRAQAKDDFVSGAQIQKRADDFGGRIGASVGDDSIELWASGPSENAPQLADLLMAVALSPRLDDRDIAGARDLLQVRGDDILNDPSSTATTALRTQLYRDAQGKATAYALPQYGTDASLASLSRAALRDLHAKFFVPSRMILSAAGDVNVALLKERLAALPTQAAAPVASPFVAPMRQEPPLVVKQTPASLAWVFISYRVAGATSDDLPALRVLAAALGEARNARLPNRLLGGEKSASAAPAKVRPATAAQVSVSFTPRRYGTEFIALAQVETARVDGVKNAMLDEIGRLRNAPLSVQELTRARNYVLGSFATDREGLHERAYLAALATSYAAPVSAASTRNGSADLNFASRVAQVKSADVQRVARKYLRGYAVALLMPSP